jgi:copper chaperone CopZ
MDTITLSIPSINCHHCIMTVKREGSTVEGAEFVSGDIPGKTATFRVESAAVLSKLKEALAAAGYPVAD